MTIHRFLIFLFILSFTITACAGVPDRQVSASNIPDGQVTLNVFAAASLTESFSEIGREFEAQHPGYRVYFNFGSSSQLAQQILQGAPADVFASANEVEMDGLASQGKLASGSRQVFAHNHLVVIFPKDSPSQLSSLQDLIRPGLRLVLAAKEVPVGQYSLEFLEKASQNPGFPPNFMKQVLNNVVSYEENVKAVVAKVSLGEADAGIVYVSDLSGKDATRLRQIPIPPELNITASYPIAVLSGSPHLDIASTFVQLVLSPDGQAILARYGFIKVNP